jgi:MFS family permease
LSGIVYKEHQTEVIASLEIASGLGVTIAPVIGSVLYSFGGYRAPFILYGVIFLIASIFLQKIIPSKVDEKHEQSNESSKESQIVVTEKVTFRKLFSKAKIIFGCFSGCLAYFAYS